MKAALDVHYEGERANAACVVFRAWSDDVPTRLVRAVVPTTASYEAGRFYRRELPCLLAVLAEANGEFETIIIDGFVHLRPGAGKGLGVYLAEALAYAAEIVGVAKNPLKVAGPSVPILRGSSKRPLHVSALGCSLEYAAASIRGMHGPHRVPTLLRVADQHARRPERS